MAERGRPKSIDDSEILDAALRSFAQHGYEATSLRTLSADLGLSHSAVGQRFGTKERVFRLAVSLEFERSFAAMRDARATWPEDLDDLDELRALIHSFLTTSAHFPALGQLMNREGVEQSDRLNFIFDEVVLPQISPIIELLHRLQKSQRIRPMSSRSLALLVAHGAGAPFTLHAYSEKFNPVDGVIDEAAHINSVTDFLMRALVT